MPDYRMYCLDRAGKIRSYEWIAAKNDNEALAFVRAKKLSVRCEIWDRNRLVGSVLAYGHSPITVLGSPDSADLT